MCFVGASAIQPLKGAEFVAPPTEMEVVSRSAAENDENSLLKGQKFDADEWAELFRRAGAKYAGPLAIFHDNYALWDSKVTRYNAVETGPKRDIVGEWGKAVRKRGMKFTPTFHHGLAWYFYEPDR